MKTLDAWMKSGEYLPQPLRDFHDQKDVFKTLHTKINVSLHTPELEHFNWRASQIYVIDIFLWFMAKRGWTLQQSRADVVFQDLDEDVDSVKAEETKAFQNYLSSRSKKDTVSAIQNHDSIEARD